MKQISTSKLTPTQKQSIMQLWNTEYPVNLHYETMEAFEAYLAKLEEPYHHLVLNEASEIIAWYADFTRAEQRWFVILIDQNYQGQGLGSQLLDQAKERQSELHAWMTNHNDYIKGDGSTYYSPAAFYRKNGFQILEEQTLVTDQLSAVKIIWKRD